MLIGLILGYLACLSGVNLVYCLIGVLVAELMLWFLYKLLGPSFDYFGQVLIKRIKSDKSKTTVSHHRWCNYMMSHGDRNCPCDCYMSVCKDPNNHERDCECGLEGW